LVELQQFIFLVDLQQILELNNNNKSVSFFLKAIEAYEIAFQAHKTYKEKAVVTTTTATLTLLTSSAKKKLD
jgi:hypothetical protein